MITAVVSARVPDDSRRLLERQALRLNTKPGALAARYLIEKSREEEYPGIAFRDGLSGREAYLAGRRVAVWEVDRVYRETRRSLKKTASHFAWPEALVERALAYARAYPDEIDAAVKAETT